MLGTGRARRADLGRRPDRRRAHRRHRDPFGLVFVTDLAHGQTASAWPHTSSAAVGVACVVLTGLAAVLAVAAARVISVRRNVPGDPVAALARNPQMAG